MLQTSAPSCSMSPHTQHGDHGFASTSGDAPLQHTQVLTPTLEKELGEEDKFPGPLPDDSSSKC